MNAELARLMDEMGLRILIDDFVGKSHYHPDLEQLPRFVDPRRLEPRFVHAAPPPIRLHLAESEPHAHYRMQRFAFSSPGETPFHEDRTVPGNLFSPLEGQARGTVLLAHGGYLGAQPRGADLRPYLRWAIELARLGVRTALPALPRHLDRAPAGTFSGERFLSGNLLETIDVIVQAVSELEALIKALIDQGLGPVALMGMSLGGLTAVQLLSVMPEVKAAVLLAPVPDAPRSLFESPIGRTIRMDWVAGGASRSDLEAVFASLSPRHRRPLQRPSSLKLVFGRYDEVVLPSDVQAMGDTWGVEVWEAEDCHLGLVSSNPLRHRATTWLAEQLERAGQQDPPDDSNPQNSSSG